MVKINCKCCLAIVTMLENRQKRLDEQILELINIKKRKESSRIDKAFGTTVTRRNEVKRLLGGVINISKKDLHKESQKITIS